MAYGKRKSYSRKYKRKSSGSRYKRKYYRKTGVGYFNKQIGNPATAGSVTCWLPYVHHLVYSPFTPASDATGTVTNFQLNGPQLPVSGADTVPYGFTQLALMYNNYKVLRVRFSVDVIMEKDGSLPYAFGIVPFVGSSAPSTTFDQAMAMPGARSGVLLQNHTRPLKLSGSHWIHKLFGLSFQQFNADPNYSCAVSAVPNASYGAFMQVQFFSLANIGGTSSRAYTPTSITYLFKAQFLTRFTNPKNLAS